MTKIALMVREDWAQRGTAMQQSSETIRSWLDDSRPVWAVGKPEKFNDRVRSADRETAVYISRSQTPRPVLDFGRVVDIASRHDASQISIVALHPYEDQDCDALKEVVNTGELGKLYVQIWARNDLVRHWLEGIGAIDLHRRAPVGAPDPLQVAACELIVNEEYNGPVHGEQQGHGDPSSSIVRTGGLRARPRDVAPCILRGGRVFPACRDLKEACW